jgi:hypothetical protein
MLYKFNKNLKAHMRKSFFISVLFAAMVVASLAFTNDAPLYKNLKVLPKNITKPQMDSVMHQFTGSLGVKCNFCHQYNEETKTMDFASDANKHKLVARNMMKMTAKINKKYFDVSGKQTLDAKLLVGCYTCHHGQEDPTVNAPHMQGPPQGAQPQPGADTTKHQ